MIAIPIVIAATERKIPLLERRYFQFFGMISYPLYLVHQNIGMTIQYRLVNAFCEYTYWYAFIAIVIVVLIAVILYCFVEFPVQRLLKNQSWRKKNE